MAENGEVRGPTCSLPSWYHLVNKIIKIRTEHTWTLNNKIKYNIIGLRLKADRKNSWIFFE